MANDFARGDMEMTLIICVLEIVYLFLWMGSGNKLFFFIALGIFLWWIYEMRREARLRQEKIEQETIQKLEKIPHNRRAVSDDCLSAILLDELSKTFYYLERDDVESNFKKKSYSFDEIYECAIAVNDSICSLISKGGTHGWSIINYDAQIYNEEDFKEEDTIHKLSLKIIVDDLSKPLIEFVFFEDKKGMEKDSEEYEEIWQECKNWHQKISVTIKRGSREIEKIAVNNWAHN